MPLTREALFFPGVAESIKPTALGGRWEAPVPQPPEPEVSTPSLSKGLLYALNGLGVHVVETDSKRKKARWWVGM